MKISHSLPFEMYVYAWATRINLSIRTADKTLLRDSVCTVSDYPVASPELRGGGGGKEEAFTRAKGSTIVGFGDEALEAGDFSNVITIFVFKIHVHVLNFSGSLVGLHLCFQYSM